MPVYRCIIPRHKDTTFQTIAEPSLKKLGTQVLQVFDNNKEVSENIFKKYNAGIEAAKQAGIKDEDIVILMHEDTAIFDNLFKEKIELLFSEKPEVGLVGVAGAIEITEKGGWWLNDAIKLRGHLIQGKDNEDMEKGFHLVKGGIGYFDNVVCIDGCMMITKGKLINEGLLFDNTTYVGNDFYDCDICLKVLEMGYKIAVADLLIFHQSMGKGMFKDEWSIAKNKFIEKWNNKGYKLPFTADQFKVKENPTNEIIEIPL
jgi:hypothetical protein